LIQTKNKKAVPFMAVALCVVILISSISMGALASTARRAPAGSPYQTQIDNLNARMAELETEERALQTHIANARGEIQQETVRRDSIDQQIRITRDQITLISQRIDVQEQYIEAQIAEIAEKQAEIDANHALFLARTRAQFVQNDTSTLGLVLGVDSFVSFLTTTDTMVRIADHDQRLTQTLTAQRRDMEEAQAKLEEHLEELEADRNLEEEKRRAYNVQREAANLRIQDLDRREREFTANLEASRAMRAQMRRELDEIFARIEWSQNPYVGGEMAWPVPGHYRITSEFGSRFGGADFHTGIDIAGSGGSIHGATVVAANSGTVRFTNWSHTPGRGYGIYLIIDHGGGVSTLYAHLSNISVNVGDVVVRGDPIGNVGSTGWSTGPHLHFEVRHSGRAVNPRPYIIGGRR